MATYRTKGSCSREIIFSVDSENKLESLKFLGGCSGNHQALSRLLVGKDLNYIIQQCKGIQCRNNTSCPDQLSIALEQYIEENQVQQ